MKNFNDYLQELGYDLQTSGSYDDYLERLITETRDDPELLPALTSAIKNRNKLESIITDLSLPVSKYVKLTYEGSGDDIKDEIFFINSRTIYRRHHNGKSSKNNY